jgi:hypothetical protein
MEKSNHKEFEKNWEDYFSQAEVSPPKTVWLAIENELGKSEAQKNKRAIFWYRSAAAASIVFAVVISLNQFLAVEEAPELSTTKTGSDKSSYEYETGTPNPSEKSIPLLTDDDDNSAEDLARSEPDLVISTINQDKTFDDTRAITRTDQSHKEKGFEQQVEPISFFANNNNREPSILCDLKRKQLNNDIQVALMELDKIFKVPIEDTRSLVDNGTFKPNFWTGINASSGLYLPGGGSSDDAIAASSFEQSNEDVFSLEDTRNFDFSSQDQSGPAYTFGLDFGYQLAPRWTVQVGLEYANFESETSTSLIAQSTDDRRIVHDSNFETIDQSTYTPSFAPSVALDNQFEFVSIPLKAGYAVINRKAKLVLTAGVSSDIFIQNTLSDQAGNFSTETVTSGENSIYRSLNWRGLSGLQFRYPFADKFQFMLEPNFRFSLNDFGKEGTGVETRPNIFGVNAGINYSFGK